MTDDYLVSLRNDWRDQPGLPDGMLARTRRARLGGVAILAFELTLLASTFGVGVWFAWVALATGRLIFAVSAMVLLVSIPAVMAAAIRARRGILKWEDETPAGVLRARLRQIDGTLRALLLGWWAIGLIAMFVAVLWALEFGGMLGERDFLGLYTIISAVYLAAAVVWILWRRPRLDAERARCEALLSEMLDG